MSILDDAEDLAAEASAESGLDDRPAADPCVLAVSYCGLRLVPSAGSGARLVEGRVYYPRAATDRERAFYVGHETMHDLIRWARWKVSPGDEEIAASRGACALILPRRAFLRDVRTEGVDLVTLGNLWPLASAWVLARRVAELRGALAVRRRKGRGVETAGAGDARQLSLALDEAEEHGVARAPGLCAVRVAERDVVGVLLETG